MSLLLMRRRELMLPSSKNKLIIFDNGFVNPLVDSFVFNTGYSRSLRLDWRMDNDTLYIPPYGSDALSRTRTVSTKERLDLSAYDKIFCDVWYQASGTNSTLRFGVSTIMATSDNQYTAFGSDYLRSGINLSNALSGHVTLEIPLNTGALDVSSAFVFFVADMWPNDNTVRIYKIWAE